MSRTPGKWHQAGLKIIGNGYAIATINSHKTTEGAANANLIAAAPELLAALEMMCRALIQSGASEEWDEIIAARSIIAKARGE
jgi:hypothetical protein